MGVLREDAIHFAVRRFLKRSGWSLLAGQYPNGSDDELPTLYITDPTVACDNSPDPRRHSKNKIVVDLVATRNSTVLLIEMKPRYSREDADKLINLIGPRRTDLYEALETLCKKRHIEMPIFVNQMTFVPCLGFSATSSYELIDGFSYFLVSGLTAVEVIDSDALLSLES